jgi:hypothetical protein
MEAVINLGRLLGQTRVLIFIFFELETDGGQQLLCSVPLAIAIPFAFSTHPPCIRVLAAPRAHGAGRPVSGPSKLCRETPLGLLVSMLSAEQ